MQPTKTLTTDLVIRKIEGIYGKESSCYSNLTPNQGLKSFDTSRAGLLLVLHPKYPGMSPS
jgi:hypothetical protein